MLNVLIGLFLATLITELFATRLFKLIFWYALNSLFLGLIALYNGYRLSDKEMIIMGLITIVVKFILIPYILKYFFIKFKIKRAIVSNIAIHYSVILIPIVLVFTLYLTTPVLSNFSQNADYISVAISSLMLSLLLMMEYKNVAVKIIGFLSIENSLFLLGLTATKGMPMLIELGVFVDLLMLIVIVNILFKYQGEKL